MYSSEDMFNNNNNNNIIIIIIIKSCYKCNVRKLHK